MGACKVAGAHLFILSLATLFCYCLCIKKNSMKTILVPVYHRQQIKTVLLSDITTELLKRQDVRLVVVVPLYRVNEFTEEFKHKHIVFEGIENVTKQAFRVDAFFEHLSRFYVDALPQRAFRKKWLLEERRQYVRYVFSFVLLMLLGNFAVLRNTVRFLDFVCVSDNRFKSLFQKYKPDLVFLPRLDLILDQSLLRQAKKRHIKTVGMIGAFGTITSPQSSYRLLPDILIVWGEAMKKQAVKYLGARKENLYVSGIPAFDHYITQSRTNKNSFCKPFSIDPAKRVVLFVSVAAQNPTEYQVLKKLHSAVLEKKLPHDIVFLVRNHPAYDMVKGNIVRGDLEPSEHVVFDNAQTFLPHKESYLENMRNDMSHLADSLYHSEMVITTASTITIEASLFDKPTIHLGFDGDMDKPLHESVARYYTKESPYYVSGMEEGGVNIARNFEELVTHINRYLENPDLDKDKRRKRMLQQAHQLDGRSGKRVVELISRIVD
jgi:hypothetical protein